MITNIKVEVSKLTKEYAILFDEPFEEVPSEADFMDWLTNSSRVFSHV